MKVCLVEMRNFIRSGYQMGGWNLPSQSQGWLLDTAKLPWDHPWITAGRVARGCSWPVYESMEIRKALRPLFLGCNLQQEAWTQGTPRRCLFVALVSDICPPLSVLGHPASHTTYRCGPPICPCLSQCPLEDTDVSISLQALLILGSNSDMIFTKKSDTIH